MQRVAPTYGDADRGRLQDVVATSSVSGVLPILLQGREAIQTILVLSATRLKTARGSGPFATLTRQILHRRFTDEFLREAVCANAEIRWDNSIDTWAGGCAWDERLSGLLRRTRPARLRTKRND